MTSTAALHKLARASLRGLALFPPHTRTPEAATSILRCGSGLDLLTGEHIVALLPQQTPGSPFEGLVFTDRTLLARFEHETFQIPLHHIQNASLDRGFLETSLHIQTPNTLHEIPLYKDETSITHFLQEVSKLGYAPSKRRAPLLVCTPNDPTGLPHLLQTLQDPTPKTLSLLRNLQKAAQEPQNPEKITRQKAARIHAHHRHERFGRARQNAHWISPLSPQQLSETVPLLFEKPHKITARGTTILVEINPPPPKNLSPKALEEALTAKLLQTVTEKTLGALAEKTLGVDLAEVLGQEIESYKIYIEEGPALSSLLEIPEEKPSPSSYWNKLKGHLPSFARDLLEADHATLSTFRMEGIAGSTTIPLARRRPDLCARLLQDLHLHETRALETTP